MVQIKVTDEVKDGKKGTMVEMELQGNKLDVIAELTLALQKFITQELSPSERFAFLMTLVKNT